MSDLSLGLFDPWVELIGEDGMKMIGDVGYILHVISLSFTHKHTHTPFLSLSHLCLGLLDPWIELLGGVGEVGQILHVLAELTERAIDKSNLLSKFKLLEPLMRVIVLNYV